MKSLCASSIKYLRIIEVNGLFFKIKCAITSSWKHWAKFDGSAKYNQDMRSALLNLWNVRQPQNF